MDALRYSEKWANTYQSTRRHVQEKINVLCVIYVKPATELQTDKHAMVNEASRVSEERKISCGLISCHNSLKSSKAHTVTGISRSNSWSVKKAKKNRVKGKGKGLPQQAKGFRVG